MRPTLITAALVAAVALAGLSSADRAQATEAAPKGDDRASIGTSGQPDAQPADPHPLRLAKAPGMTSRRSAAALPSGAKPQSVTTSESIAVSALSAAQRAKLAAITAAVATPQAMTASGKPANMSTILPPVAGAPALSAQALLKAKLAAAQASAATPAIGFARPNSSTSALGVIPRPEWLTGLSQQKPKDISTIGTAPPGGSSITPPSAIELQRRAAATSNATRGAKPAAITTSLPRDPSVPADAAKPSPSDSGKQGVQP